MSFDLNVHAERTPNPDSIKWVLGQPVVAPGVSAHFDEPPPHAVSPLAARLFQVPGVKRVFLAANFVTVTRHPEMQWPDLARPLLDALRSFVESGEAALGPAFEASPEAAGGEVAVRIQQVLDREIRPAVARDGGDVTFVAFRNGTVELVLQGSCSGCPSATATLKLGIEARLREVVPEVNEVVAL